MTIKAFLTRLRGLDIKLWVEGERLRYSAPQGALTPELLQQLAERKPEIISFLRGADSARHAATHPLRPVPRAGVLPLSFAQQRVWFWEQMNAASAAYNVPVALRLKGELAVEALVDSLQELVRRHEALRTTFVEVGGQPTQVVSEPFELSVPRLNVNEAEVGRLVHEFSRHVFDLARGPLIKACLLRLADDEHVLLVNMHHIVSDGWSKGVLVRELATLYTAKLKGEPSRLAPLPIQYADYAVWQRGWMEGAVLERELGYWREQLAGLPPLLELPADRARPAVQSFRGGKISFEVSKSLTDELHALSREENCTLFMTLLAAFDVLLARHAGRRDIAVGSPIANRTHSEVEGLIGFFVNTLVLRARVAPELTFKELLAAVRATTLEAYAHQSVPFEQVVEALSPERSLSYSPLFQVEFILQNAPLTELRLPGLHLSSVEQEGFAAKFDLSLSLYDSGEGLRGSFVYNADIFERGSVERMRDRYRTLLEAVVTDRARKVSRLPLLTDAERRQVLSEWNRTEAVYPEEGCIHELFEAQARRSPEAVAVVFGGRTLTYAELNRRANQLAAFLLERGVGPDARVGLCVERSPEMCVGLLGILKAGGAYVPLDPAYPRERLALMLKDSGAAVVVTTRGASELLPQADVEPIYLDADWPRIAQRAAENPAVRVHPLNLGYLIYTSGSTGKPKGVALTRQALVNLIHWYAHNHPRPERPRTLQFASVNFDVSFEEMLTTWHAGGTLFVLSEEERHDPSRLLRLLSEWSVERMFSPVVVLQQLAQTFCDGPPGVAPQSLRQVITAGSQLQITEEIRRFFQAMPDCELHNNYGPSETHTMMRHRLGRADDRWPALPPIGRPFSNTRIYVLDADDQPVPLGAHGELCIGGAQVGRGYWARPSLTAERFIPDPFSEEGGERLYRSGDIVRMRPDGCVEWLGRGDNQVKVRGFRVELGEVEAVVRGHRAVREVAVVAREDRPGDQRLVAYFEPAEGAVVETSELGDFVRSKLPNFMTPSAFVEMAALPLTPSGKIDRKNLPAPDMSEQLGRDFVAPRTPDEELLAGIWAEVLGHERVGVHDSFFEIGGHSLLATRVISRVRSAFSIELPIHAIFEAPTVAGLARRVEESVMRKNIEAVSFVRGGRDPRAGTDEPVGEEDELVL